MAGFGNNYKTYEVFLHITNYRTELPNHSYYTSKFLHFLAYNLPPAFSHIIYPRLQEQQKQMICLLGT